MSQSPVAPSSAFAPGWYSDPNGMPANRWWDGNGWTEHLQPTGTQAGQPVAQYAAPAPSYPDQYVAPQPSVAQYTPPVPQAQPLAPTPQYAAPGFPAASPAAPLAVHPEGTFTPVAAPAKRGRYNPYDPTADLASGKNTPARNALILGIIALVINPVCIPALAAVFWGIVGIKRASKFAEAGSAPVGKGKAIAGLVLGSIGVVATLLFKGFMF
jgi:hypothetical protein